ncbi:MAG: bile acid:sodium symporter family protein [Solirubrobacterales bacterium]
MKQVIEIAVPAITFVLMTVVGLSLTFSEFGSVRCRPGVVLAGLVGPVLLLPPIALILIELLAPPPELRAGLLLLAACPMGAISSTYTYLAKASTALSVTLTVLSCLAALVTIPILSHVYQLLFASPFGFAVPLPTLVTQLLLMLTAPVALGMSLRHVAPSFARLHENRLRVVGFGALALLIALVIADQRDWLVLHLWRIVLLAAAMTIAALAVGLLVGWLCRAGRHDRFTLGVGIATRNAAIATAIAVTVLGRIQFAVFATTYFLVEVPIMLVAIGIFRWRTPKGSGGF